MAEAVPKKSDMAGHHRIAASGKPATCPVRYCISDKVQDLACSMVEFFFFYEEIMASNRINSYPK
jgi:hypothetical protein